MRNLSVIALATVICVLIGCLGGGGGGGSGGGTSPLGPVDTSGALLSGRVYFAETSLYGGIPVLAKDATGLVVGSTRTDSQGNFAFSDIPAGVYNLYASTGESEILFFSGAQAIAANPVSIPEKSLIELESVILDQVTSSSVRLRFRSTVSTVAQISYGPSTANPSTVSTGASYETTHSTVITGLVPGTRYGFSIKAQSQDGQNLTYPVLYTTTTTSVGPGNLSVSINNGDMTTRNLANRIYLNAEGASQMRVGTSEDLTSQPWETFSLTKDITFTSGDGTRRVYVQFRDVLGNMSGVINDSILLQTDSSGYLGVWINSGEALTNQLDVILTLLYPGATQMQVSDRADFLSSFWEGYTSTRKMRITSGDGPKTVYVRFKGGKADETKVFSATIQLDTAGPVVEVVVNNGALKTNQNTALLSFTYSKQPTDMQIQTTNTFSDTASWLKFANPYKYVLSSGDGAKIFYVRFKDSLGNISAPVEARITLDTKAPENPSLLINGGDETTQQLNVKLTLEVTGDEGESVYMMISNNESFAGAGLERYSKTKAWTLGGYGLQSVYAMFLDDASNTTTILVESIEVEGEPPSSGTIKINDGDPSTESKVVSLTIVSDSTKKIRLAEHENFSNVADVAFVPTTGTTTMKITGFQLSPVAGEKRVYVRMEDASGTFSISSDSILLVGPASYSLTTPDTQPLGSFSVNLRPFALNAAQMLITESYANLASESLWRPFVYSTSFDLEKYVGKHTIYAKYRTTGQVETPVLSLDVLITETSPATPAIIVNLGDAITTSSRVQVKVLTSGIYTQMQLSNDGTFYNSAVLPVADTLWDITRADGQKTVYARFFNPQSSNYEIVTDLITARGPASTSILTREAQPLNKNWVQLELFAEGATDMIVTDDPSIKSMTTGWIAYQNSLVFPLGDQTGQRTVYAKFRNAATNWIESLPVQTTVTVNASAPTGNTVAFRETAAADSTRVTQVAPASMPIYLHFNIVDEDTASIAWKIVAGGAAVPAAADMQTEVVPVAPILLTQASFGGYGIFNLYYQFSDGVGNKSALGVTSILIIDPNQVVTPTTGQITINNGDAVSESSRLNLNLYSTTATKVRVSQLESFSTIPDITYVSGANGMNITYDISPPTAGSKRIYARFESASGTFGFASDSITLVGPANATMTVRDALPLNKMWVELSLNAENASRMLISESLASFSSPALYWEPYSYRKVFPLENRVGSHTIYCRFYNSTTTWIETDLLQTSVSVNATVPTGNTASFRTNVASNSAVVSEISPASMPFYLHFNIADKMTATVSYRLARADAPVPALLDYSLPILPVPMNPADFSGYGTFNLYYSFVDGVGNRSAIQIVPVVILEPGTEYSPVNGTVKINDGDSSTDRREVSLNLFSETATKIKISQSDTFSSVAEEPYVANTTSGAMIKTGYQLSTLAGVKNVYVRFEDASGSFIVVNDSINLVGPSSYSISTPDLLPLTTYNMHLRPVADGANEMLVTEDYAQLTAGTGWASFSYAFDFPLQNFEGAHKIYARYRNAGFVETPVMTLDVSVVSTPEASPTILINDGDLAVSQRLVTLRLFSESAASFTVSESLSFAGSTAQNYVAANPDGSMFFPFTLSPQAGEKTVYVRYANAFGVYAVVNDSITVTGPTGYSLATNDSLPLATYTVNLLPFAENANEMLISESFANITSGSGWASFSYSLPFTLAAFEGNHTVYAKYRNTGNIETPVMSLVVAVDMPAPASAAVLVNYGDLTTVNPSVTLRLYSSDAASFTVSESLNFSGKTPVLYIANNPDGSMIHNLQLSSSAGDKTVYVRFANASGLLTLVNDGITLTGPTNNSLTTSDALPLATYSVNLKPFADGANEMLISESYASLTAGLGWASFSYALPFKLTTSEGNHTIYAKYRNLYNVESSVMTLAVAVDLPEPASPSVLINNGDLSSSDRLVSLRLYSYDAASFTVSESQSFTGATPVLYVPNNPDGSMIYNLQLSSSAGDKTVYVRFANASGALTLVNDGIVLTGPTNNSLTTSDALPLATYSINLKPFADGANEMLVTEDYAQLTAGTGWASFSYAFDFPLQNFEGAHKIYARYRNAGFVETPVMTLDVSVVSTPEASPTILINDGDLSVSQRLVTLRLFSESAASFTVSESLSFAGSTAQNYIAANPDGSMFFPFTLSPQAGEKTVYVRYANASGVYSVVNDGITVTGPTGYSLATNDSLPLATYTVNLLPFAENANEMLISESFANITSGSGWASFSYSLPFNLATFEGNHTVYAKYRNTGNIETPVMSLVVAVDLPEPASAAVLVNYGDLTTVNPAVTLRLYSSDAASFTVSESLNFSGKTPVLYVANNPDGSMIYNLQLSSSAGDKTVYVRFANASGVLTLVNDGITLTGPTNNSLTTSDALPLATYSVNLKPFADSANEMLISESYASLTAGIDWASFSYALPFKLTTSEGNHTIYAKYRNLYNVESSVMTLSVTVDLPEPASPSVIINNGDLSSSDRLVSLRLYSHDAASFTVSESLNFAGATPVLYIPGNPDGSMLYNMQLSASAGDKTVYVRFANASGVLTLVNDGITLTGPTNNSLTTSDALPLATYSINLKPFADGANEMLISESYASLTAGIDWASFSYALPFKLTTSEGNHTIYAKYRNLQNVESLVMTLNVTVDIPDPATASVLINNGDLSSSDPLVSLRLFSSDAASFTVSESLSFAGATVTTYIAAPDGSMQHNYQFSPTAGDKTLYVRYQNASGVFTVANDAITLAGPTGQTLTTNDTQPLSTYTVNLRPFATGANEMLLTENYALLASDTMWASFTYSVNMALGKTDGKHTIYARYRNTGHVETAIISLDVNVETDPAAASPSIVLNGGDSFTTYSSATVNVTTGADYSGVMRLSEDGDFFSLGDVAAIDQPFIFSNKQAGTKTVYARFKHNTRNEYVTVSDSITVRGPASATIATRDAQPMNKNWVDLDLYAVGADQMLITTSIASFTDLTLRDAYSSRKIFSLGSLTGPQTIYCKFYSPTASWVESDVISLAVTVNNTAPTGDTAILRQTVAPTSNALTEVAVGSLPVYLHLTKVDPDTATASYQLASAGSPLPTTFKTSSLPVAPIVLDQGDFIGNGTFNLYYKFSDAVGNETPLSVTSIKILGPSLNISPKSVGPFYSGQTQQFLATLENVEGSVRWTASPTTGVGIINSSTGYYTAPNNITTPASVTIKAELFGSNPLVYDEVSFELQTQIEVSVPSTYYKIKVNETATTLVRFVNSSMPGLAKITDPSGGVATITDNPAVAVPPTDKLASLTFTAPSSVPTNNPVAIQIVSNEDPSKSAIIFYEILGSDYVYIAPATTTMRLYDGRAIFVAEASVLTESLNWTLTGGASFSNGLAAITTNSTNGKHSVEVRAPAIGTTVTLKAVYATDSSIDDTAIITLSPRVTIAVTPKTKSIYLADTTGINFQANVTNATSSEVFWEFKNASDTIWVKADNYISAVNGTLDTSGLDALYLPPELWPSSFTPPVASITVINVRATSKDDATASAVATVKLLEALKVRIHDGFSADTDDVTDGNVNVTLEVGKRQFFAEVGPVTDPTINTSVTWYVQNIAGGNSTYGTVDTTGKYTAPDTAVQEAVTLKAVSVSKPTAFAETSIKLLDFWVPKGNGLQSTTNATFPIYCMQIDPKTLAAADRTLYTGTNGFGAYRTNFPASADENTVINWNPVANLSEDDVGINEKYIINDLAMSVQHPTRLVAATNAGLFLINNLTASMTPIAVGARLVPGVGGPLYGAFTQVFSSVVIDPTNDTYMYAAGKDQGVLRFIWNTANSTYEYNGTLYDDREDRNYIVYEDRVWTPPHASATSLTCQEPVVYGTASGTMQFNTIEINPQNPNVLYVGYTNFHESTGPDVFRNGYLTLGNIRSSNYLTYSTANYPYAGAWSWSGGDPVVSYVYNGFLVWPPIAPLTRNLGLKYISTAVLFRHDNDSSIIHDIEVDPNTTTTIWLAKDTGIFRSTNDGSLFTSQGAYTNVFDIFIDPINTVNVYIGTESGLYRSRDAGATWKQIKSGLEGHTTINTLGLTPGGIGLRRIFCGTTNGIFMGRTTLDLE